MIVQVKMAPWDKIFEFTQLSNARKIKINDFKMGEWVVVKIDSHTDLGRIEGILEKEEKVEAKEKIESGLIIRKANADDFKNMEEKEAKKDKVLEKAAETIRKHKLSMKLVDVHFSLDGGEIVLAFVASERVDFRELVKNLSKEFHKSIRMHQVNPREEVKSFSGFGPCGRKICCASLLKNVGGITTDLVGKQQLIHRGVERLSGLCGRLKCCLAFERDLYEELARNFPFIGSIIKVKDKEGEVINWHILRQSVDLKIDKDTIIEVPIRQITNNK